MFSRPAAVLIAAGGRASIRLITWGMAAMILEDLIVEKQADLEAICRRRSVARLELFGSAAKGTADPESSDLDFLVEFQELPFGKRSDAFFGLLQDLEALFGRKVDLVEEKAVTNPYFIRNIRDSRRLLYAA